MPIWSALSNNAQPVSKFQERNIANLMPGRVSDLAINGYNTGEYRNAFQRSIANIGEVMYATNIQKAVVKPEAYRAILPALKLASLVEAPILSISFDAEDAGLAEALKGFGMTADATLKHTWHGSPTSEAIKGIMLLGPREGRFVPGKVNMDGYLSYLTAWKAATAFAIVSDSWRAPNEPVRFNKDELPDTYTELDEDRAVTALLGSKEYPIEKHEEVVDDATSVLSIGWSPIFTPINELAKIESPVKDFSYKPKAGGHVFPYFDGLVLPDKEFAYGIFQRYFTRCLAEDASKTQTVLGRLRNGMRSLAATKAGLVLCHVYLGIQLAENSQAGLKLIVHHNRYHGFVLENPSAVIVVRGQLHVAADPAKMALDILQLDSHQIGITEILAIIHGPKENGKSKYSCTAIDLNSPRKLNSVISNLDGDDFDDNDWKAIDLGVGRLSYGEKYEDVTPETLKLFLRYALTREEALIQDKPFYYMGGLYKSDNYLTRGLAMFGPRAPSFLIGGTMVFQIPTTGQDSLMTRSDSGHRLLRYLPYRLKPLRNAMEDWVKLFASGKILLPAPRKDRNEWIDRKQIDGFVDDANIEDVYGLLKENVLKSKLPADGAKKAKKRARGVDEDDDADGRSSKTSKKMVADAGLF